MMPFRVLSGPLLASSLRIVVQGCQVLAGLIDCGTHGEYRRQPDYKLLLALKIRGRHQDDDGERDIRALMRYTVQVHLDLRSRLRRVVTRLRFPFRMDVTRAWAPAHALSNLFVHRLIYHSCFPLHSST